MKLTAVFPAMLLCFLTTGCSSPQKYYENGKIERAYKTALREAGNRKQAKADALNILAASYTQLQQTDIARIEALETGRQPDRWLSLYPIYRLMHTRRSEIDPFLPQMRLLNPLYDLKTLAGLTERARTQAGDYCLREAETLAAAARSGDKQAARTACEWLDKASEYTPYCVDVEEGCRVIEKVVQVNDSTTVVIVERIPVIVTVCATVVTIDRYKYASAVMDLWLETPNGEPVTEVWSLSETNDWHNRAADCSGDSRALPGPCFGVNLWHPSDRYMIQTLAYAMRRALIADVKKMFR